MSKACAASVTQLGNLIDHSEETAELTHKVAAQVSEGVLLGGSSRRRPDMALARR
jgi:hypothetical protein